MRECVHDERGAIVGHNEEGTEENDGEAETTKETVSAVCASVRRRAV